MYFNTRGIVLEVDEKERAEYEYLKLQRERNGLSLFNSVEISYRTIHEILLAMLASKVITDVTNTIIGYCIKLLECNRTNESRSLEFSRLTNWEQYYSDIDTAHHRTLIQSAVTSIGDPLYMFTYTRGVINIRRGWVPRTEGVFFAIRKKDKGINARLTHSVPSVMRNINHVGMFQRVVGWDPEPIGFSLCPLLSLSEWTVFRIPPGVLLEDNQLLWFTVFSVEGFLSTRPFTCSFNHWFRDPRPTISDIASVVDEAVLIGNNKYLFSELSSWIK